MPPTSTAGCVWMLATADGKMEQLLDAIPSETSKAERRFLFHFFRSVWDGHGDVLEVGPFLGGTTRAIALGMWNHPARDLNSRLYVFDRFDNYYDEAGLIKFVDPLFESGVLRLEDRDVILKSDSFEFIFHKVHAGYPYHDLIHSTNGPLPDAPGEEAALTRIFSPPRDRFFSAVFVDGCKSWFGTRYFMEKMATQTRPGAWFIAQDYGQYTCFWLPVFFEVFADAFDLHAYVDATYCFQLKRTITPEEIRARFPDEAEAWGVDQFGALFKRLIEKACNRDDYRSRLVYSLQWAAALAYTGRKNEARAMLDRLVSESWTYGHAAFIREVRKNPTYRARMTGIEEVTL